MDIKCNLELFKTKANPNVLFFFLYVVFRTYLHAGIHTCRVGRENLGTLLKHFVPTKALPFSTFRSSRGFAC